MSFDPELAGFGSGLANAYIRKMDIINRGFSRYNTDWSLPILKQILPTIEDQARSKASIPLMTIFFGANDAALYPSPQHVPVDKYKSNIKEMVNLIKNPQSEFYNPKMRLILITPPPLYEPLWKKRCEERGDPMNRTNESAKIYAEALKETAKELNVVVIDLWTAIMSASEQNKQDLSYFLSDGLHLTDKGYKILFDAVMDTISTHFPDIHPDALEFEIAVDAANF
ncbi:hypothetical protein RMATCC62417_02586 [Rhizopus microsporus]|nr:hypothetical protein RMATCC62417_02586 [Rhizopus microsporus]